MHRLARSPSCRSASVSWISPPRPGRSAQDVEDLRRQHVPADDGQVARRLLGPGLLDQAGDRRRPRRRRSGSPAGSTLPYSRVRRAADLDAARSRAAVLGLDVEHGQQLSRSSIMSSPSSTANGSSPTNASARSTAWPRPRASPWRMKCSAPARWSGAPGQPVGVALLLQRRLELRACVEIVLDRRLAAAGDDQDVGAARRGPPRRRCTPAPARRRPAAAPWAPPWSPAGTGCRARPPG